MNPNGLSTGVVRVKDATIAVNADDKTLTLSDGGWRCGTRVSIESMEEWQPIYTEVGGDLAGMPS
jgi:hypothetical protein